MKTLSSGLKALTVPDEQQEILVAGIPDIESMKRGERVTVKNGVILERSFDQKMYNQKLEVVGMLAFVRVVGPVGHRSLNSDLSLDGLKEWGII